MSYARIEPLDSRRLLSGSPHGGKSDHGNKADTDPTGVGFDDLVSLAQNYNNAPAFTMSDFDSGSFSSDWTVAQSLAGSDPVQPPAPEPMVLNSKGKLIVTMSSANNGVSIARASDGATRVALSHASKLNSGSFHSTIALQQKFHSVKSIEVIGSDSGDLVTLSGDLRFTTVRTGKGADTVIGGEADSAIYGGDGDDQLHGGGGSDAVFGEGGDDRLWGDAGDDRLDGGAGRDRLDGGRGRNKLAGGSGTDYVTLRAGKDKTDRDVKDKLKELA